MNKKRNIKIYIIFALVMAACLTGGFFTGRLMRMKEDVFNGLNWDKFAEFTAPSLPIAYALIVALIFAFCCITYVKTRTRSLQWDGEDDDEINTIERRIGLITLVSALTLVLSMMIFAVCVWAFIRIDGISSVLSIVSEITFLLSYVFYGTIIKLAVDLEKKLNPEKRGNPFDFHFVKQWESTSDEGEILAEAKAGRKAFYFGLFACMAGWIIGFVSMIVLHTGVLAVICSCMIMIVMYLTYGIEMIKQNK